MLHKSHNWKRFTNFVTSVSVKGKNGKYDFANTIKKKLNLMQIHVHLHEVKILQIHNARPEFVKNITAINQSESSILI
jgi:hypothetical protein